ncbi:MAG: 16S rRNA (cytosine(1402)-N(4))-methyltransferase RsmH [Acidimicrobiales bacterium]
MLAEVVEALVATPQGVLVDATVGGGGHAAAVLEASSKHRLIGIDQDEEAVAAARLHLAPFGARAKVVRSRFDRIGAVLAELAPFEPVSGVFFDLGVSSWQFDQAGRGFSYRFDAPLDMRMDRSSELTAERVVNEWDEAELSRIFAESGENRFARRIARVLVANRPITTTSELTDSVRAAIPRAARQRGGHPAKRVFQALRIAVNAEIEVLEPSLDDALAALVPGGRCVVLSYHSGEDRLVKRLFADAEAGWCTCPPQLPCICGAEPAVRVLTRGARMPQAAETAANRRAASARLRIAERLDAPYRRRGGESQVSSSEEEGL